MAAKISGVPHLIPHRIHINGNDTGQIQLRVRGMTGQTANIFEVQNVAGTTLFSVNNDGDVSITGDLDAVVNETLTGNIILSGNLTVNGNTTIGNAVGDTLTVTATSTFQNPVTMDGTLDVTGILETQSHINTINVTFRRRGSTPATIGSAGRVYTFEGDADTTELFYLDAAGNTVQITDAGALEGASLFWDDDEYIRMGNTAAAPDVRMGWNTTQTVDAWYFGTADAQNTLIIAENGDRTFDRAVAAQINPTLYIFSAAQNTTQWLSLANNQTDSVITTGTGGIQFTQTAGTTGLTGFTFNIGAHTGITADTERIGIDVAAVTKTWAVAVAPPQAQQREVVFRAPTYIGNAGGASTITDAATVYIDADPVQGANMTLTNIWGLWIDAGNIRLDGLVEFGAAPPAGTTASTRYQIYRSGTPSLTYQTPTGVNHQFFAAAVNLLEMNEAEGSVFNEGGEAAVDFRIESDALDNIFQIDAGNNTVGIGATATDNQFVTITERADATGVFNAFVFNAAAHTALTTDTEVSSWILNFDAGNKTWTADTAGGITLQREFRIDAPTYIGTAAGTTIADAATVYINAGPTAGANMTITRSNALQLADNAIMQFGTDGGGRIFWGGGDASAQGLYFIAPETGATDRAVFHFADANVTTATDFGVNWADRPHIVVWDDGAADYYAISHNSSAAIFDTNDGPYSFALSGVIAANIAVTAGDETLFNSAGIDIDFAVGSDNLARALAVDGALDTIGIGIGGQASQFLTIQEYARATGTPKGFAFIGAAHTGLTAATEVIGVDWDVDATKTWAAGAGPLAQQREIIFRAPTYAGDVAGALTITAATLLSLSGNPIDGANMTITTARVMSIEAASSGAGTLTNTIGLNIENQSLAAATSGFAISIQSQTANATTTRAINIAGTGVNNAIRLGGSPNIYSSGAEVIRFADSTDGGGLSFTLTAAGDQAIRTIDTGDNSIQLQNQTFTAGSTHEAVTLAPSWTAENFQHNAINIVPTQSGANTNELRAIEIDMQKLTGATTLGTMAYIQLNAPAVTGTVTNVYGLSVNDISPAGGTTSYAIRILSQTANATTTRAMLIAGTGANNAIELGDSPLIYSSGAEVIRFDDSTAARGIAFTLTAAGAQDIAATAGNLQITGVAGAEVDFNSAQADINLRVRTLGGSATFFVDAGLNSIGLGTAPVSASRVEFAAVSRHNDAVTAYFGTNDDFGFNYDETTTDSLILTEGTVGALAFRGSAIAGFAAAADTAGNGLFLATQTGGASTGIGRAGGGIAWTLGSGSAAAGASGLAGGAGGSYTFVAGSGAAGDGAGAGGDGGGFDYSLGVPSDTGGSSGSVGSFTISQTYSGSTGVNMNLLHSSISAADGDAAVTINFQGNNATPSTRTYARIVAEVQDPAAGSEEGILRFSVNENNSVTEYMRLDGTDAITEVTFSKNIGTVAGVDFDLSAGGRLFGGGVQFNKQDLAAATNLTLDENDSVVNVTTGGGAANTITLPAASGNEGQIISVYLVIDGAQNANVVRAGADVIQNGSADLANTQVALDDAGDFVMLQCVNSTMWQILINSGGTVT